MAVLRLRPLTFFGERRRLDAMAATLDDVAASCARMETAIAALAARVGMPATPGETIMADLTALTASVQQTIGVEQSALTLIQGLASELAAAGTDPAALADLKTRLDTEAATLAAAVAANPLPSGGV